MAAVKTSPPHSSASPVSSPEAIAPEQMTQPVQKRKGGRKPVYATQEERKMRNRAAQAAFRERRTEYIKHLEATIKHHEEQLTGLQQSSRQAADEVLMLRYKNSLLERILLEKGIDVAAELRTYTGAQYDDRPTPVSQPTMPQSIVPITAHPIQQQPPQQAPGLQGQLHRPAINRQQSQQKRAVMNAGQDAVFIKTSPDSLRPMRNQSPSVAGAAIPTPPDHSAFQLPPQNATSTTQPEFQTPGLPVAQTYYPSPYQTHMEELGKLPREYDAELLENADDDTQSPLDQQPTPDGRGDGDLSMGNTGGPSSAPVRNGPEQQAVTTSGPANAYGIFDTNFDSMFASAGDQPKHDAGLSDIMRQYGQMPFGFATSNLR